MTKFQYVLTRKAARRSRVSHVDSKAYSSHSCHSDDVQGSSLDPLSKGRARVPGRSAIVCRTRSMVALREDARLLLVGARCGCRVGIGGGSSPVEETHVV